MDTSQTHSERLIYFLSRRWIHVISLILGIYIGLPFLAPVFMQIGWSGPARVIYFIYSWLCHQLPQRSYFLFGPKRLAEYNRNMGPPPVHWKSPNGLESCLV
jgi:hypothetical protein